MPSTVTELVFREPSGRPETLVQFGLSVSFLGMYLLGWVVDSASMNFLLVIAVGTALSGIAESLPERRRQTAGVLRLTAMLVLLSGVAAAVLAPGLVFVFR